MADYPVLIIFDTDIKTDTVYCEYRKTVERFERKFPERLYNRILPLDTPYEGWATFDYPDAVGVYRSTLAGALDGSVVICVVGFLTALAGLLKSQPDEISAHTGTESVLCKMRHVVSMAVVSPCTGRGGTAISIFSWISPPPNTWRTICRCRFF